MENHFTAFFSHLGQRLLGGGNALPVIVSANAEEEIPRYPPFMKGLPAAPVDRILATQTELIKAIEQALALPDDLYRRIALPVIGRYAAYSHLLPASENHHHRGAGGLFRHGLEAAHWATLASQGCLFATQATPKERKLLEPRWRLAVCFAGLLHDIGKPVSDMAVVDQQGQHAWNPCDENLTDWAAQHAIDRYFLRWRENRHKRHEQFSALVIERVLTRESRSYILEPGPDIMQAMLETIHGLDRGAKCYELVMEADRKSVERDLKAHYHGIDSAMGMPVEKYLFDAMRRLIKSGQWAANEKGARVWRFKEGIHIVWRTAVKEILSTLAKDNIPGIPRDEDTLADILIERGLAIPKRTANGGLFRYWRMQPDDMDATLFMLRLSSIELIYSGEPPVVVGGMEIGDGAEIPAIASVNDKPKPTKLAFKQQSVPDKAKPKTVEIEIKQNEPVVPQPDKYVDVYPFDGYSDVDDYAFLAGMHEADLPPELNKDVPSADQLQSTQEAESIQPAEDEIQEPQIPHANHTPETQNLSKTVAKTEDTVDQAEKAKQWLESQGQAGGWLIQLSEEIKAGRWQWGIDLLEVQDKCLLAFPGTAQILKIEANLFIKTLDEKGWLVTDLLSPMRKVQEINQIRGVLLAIEPSSMLKQLLSTTKPTQTISEQPLVDPSSNDQLIKPIQPERKIKQKAKKSSQKIENKSTASQQGKNTSVVMNERNSESPTQTGNQQTDQDSVNSEANHIENLQNQKQAEHKEFSGEHPEKQYESDKSQPLKPNRTKKADQNERHRQAINTWVIQLEKSQSQFARSETEEHWSNVDDKVIEQLLQETPGLTRMALMNKIGLLPNFRSLGNTLQIRREL